MLLLRARGAYYFLREDIGEAPRRLLARSIARSAELGAKTRQPALSLLLRQTLMLPHPSR